MCPYETGRAYTSVDIDVSTDVDTSYLYAAKVPIIPHCLSSVPQYHGVYIQRHCDFTEYL